jgi:hypothetical protein
MIERDLSGLWVATLDVSRRKNEPFGIVLELLAVTVTRSTDV